MKRARKSGFTLVEIMIVILIIVMLTQLGNFTSLFRNKEKSQVEEIAVQVLSMIDEEKTNALLGKTQKTNTSGSDTWEIVRKRFLSISIDNDNNKIDFLSQVNLVNVTEDVYEPEKITKSWTLPELSSAWYDCSAGGEGVKLQDTSTDIKNVHIEFTGDTLKFSSGNDTSPTALSAQHIVLKITRNTANQEIHIDRRTGLTYARGGYPEKVLCN